MGVYFHRIKSILEVKRTINGKEEDLDDEDEVPEKNEPEQAEDSNEEQEVDMSEHNDPEDSGSDYSMETDDETESEDVPETEEDNTQEDSSEEDNESEHNDPEDSGSDYSMETDDDTENSDEETDTTDVSDEEAEDSGEETDQSGGGEDELKTMEDEMFKDLSEDQLKIKLMELKQQYFEVYTSTSNVLIRVNKIPKSEETLKVLEFIINKLMELRDLIQFYLTNTFDTKTYIENTINYQQYLATLNTINKLFKEISVKKENNA